VSRTRHFGPATSKASPACEGLLPNGNRIACLALAVAALSWTPRAEAQSTYQAWYDFEFDYLINPKLLLQAELGPKVLLSGEGSGWNSVDFSPGLEYSAANWVDLLFYVPLSYTVQAEGINTFEMRGSVGARFIYRPQPRLVLRNRTLLEYRNLHYQSTDSTEVSTRFRTRIEARYALNRPSYSSERMLYGITDLEAFINFGAAPDERFLNRVRFRVGLGYRFTHFWSAEGIYTLQSSKNTLAAGEPSSVDNILRLRLVHYFN